MTPKPEPQPEEPVHWLDDYPFVVVYQNSSTIIGCQPCRSFHHAKEFRQSLPPGSAWKIYGPEGALW